MPPFSPMQRRVMLIIQELNIHVTEQRAEMVYFWHHI